VPHCGIIHVAKGEGFLSLGAVILLAIVQGLTEFLPISSSGHLVLAQYVLGVESPGVALEVALHIGTLISVVIVFWADILGLLRAGISILFDPFNRRSAAHAAYRRLIFLLVVGSVPTGVLGLLFADTFELLFANPRFIGYALLVTGCLLFMATVKQGSRGMRDMGPSDVLWVGLAQGLAITPGISRSGSTIAAGLMRGLDRDTATRLSFLLSLPAVLGAAILKTPELFRESSAHPIAYVLIGIVVSALVGIVAIKYLVAILRRGKLQYFAYYVWAVGLLTIFFVK